MKIALTYTGSEEKHANYIRWLQAGSEEVEVVTLSVEKDNLHELQDCDALVLSGGVDIDPGLYGKEKDYPNAPEKFNKKRDLFEITAFTQTQERSLPVLAICRGMQLVNCLAGGSLQQDLGKGNTIHRAQPSGDKAHGATIEKGTLLYDIVQAERTVINSAHHQAVKKPGKGLKVNCRADDGTIEGLEWAEPAGKPFLLGIQWHPERMYKFQLDNSPVCQAIRNHFVSVVQKNRKEK